MSQSIARKILLQLIKSHDTLFVSDSGKIITLEEVLTVLKGRKVNADEAIELCAGLCATR